MVVVGVVVMIECRSSMASWFMCHTWGLARFPAELQCGQGRGHHHHYHHHHRNTYFLDPTLSLSFFLSAFSLSWFSSASCELISSKIWISNLHLHSNKCVVPGTLGKEMERGRGCDLLATTTSAPDCPFPPLLPAPWSSAALPRAAGLLFSEDIWNRLTSEFQEQQEGKYLTSWYETIITPRQNQGFANLVKYNATHL